MSRLDSFIRRMCAQRDILNALAPDIAVVDGLVLEFGLGSGRTLDHLLEILPGRRILVFERDLRLDSPKVMPPAELVGGDLRLSTARLEDGCAALVHADIDTGQPGVRADLAEWLPGLVARLLVRGGLVASSIPVPHPRLQALDLPPSVPKDRYFLARRTD